MENPKDCAYPLSPVAIAQKAVAADIELPPAVTQDVTESTNDETLRLARAGAPEWTVVTAERQSAGRGRLDRSWESRAGDGLLFSVLLRPPAELPTPACGWLPLMAGVAVTRAVRSVGISAVLKWPNDVIVEGAAFDGSPGPRKLAGILAERGDGFVIVGIGLNVCSAQADLPIPTATSMRIEAERFAGESREASEWDRASLLVACLSQWQSLWSGFVAAGGDATASGLAQDYQALCATIGQQVRADVAGADPVVGTAASIDGQGHLVIESDMHRTAVAAADIRHLR